MICVTTRFQLKHFWSLVPMYLTYRRLRRDLKKTPGLIRHAFLFENPAACATLSVWESQAAIVMFSNLPSHLRAVRRAHRLCRDIWSAHWRLEELSESANQWPGTAPLPALSARAEQAGYLAGQLGTEADGR